MQHTTPCQRLGRPVLEQAWDNTQDLEFMLVHVDLCTFETGVEEIKEKKSDKVLFSGDEQINVEEDIELEQEESTWVEAMATYRLYGTTKEGYSVFAIVQGFLPYYYFEVPSDFDGKWTNYHANAFVEALKDEFRRENYKRQIVETAISRGIANAKIVSAKKLYGFTNEEQFQFIRVDFTSLFSYRAVIKFFKTQALEIPGLIGETTFHLAEHRITPVTKFLLDLALVPSGWIKLSGLSYGVVTDPVEVISHCQINVVVSHYKCLQTCQDMDEIAPLIVASLDIECMREDQSPDNKQMPNASKPGDQVIQIGLTLFRWGNAEHFYQSMFTLGNCEQVDGLANGIVIRSYPTEEELLYRWNQYWCQEVDADLVIGWNIGFDINYLYDRATKICEIHSFLEWGKVRGERNETRRFGEQGPQQMRGEGAKVGMTGRVIIDMMQVVQKEHKLKSYGLSAVAQHFLGDDKEDLPPEKIFEYQLKTDWHRTQIAIYCAKDTLLPLHLMLELCTMQNLVEFSRVTFVPMVDIYSRGQQVKTYTLTIQQAHIRGFIMSEPPRGTLMAPIRASDVYVEKMHGWDYYKRRAKLEEYEEVEVPLSKAARAKLKAFDAVPKQIRKRKANQEKGFEGAIVQEPKKGYYKEPIPTLDFASLYPSIMISFHLCYTSIVLEKRFLGIPGVSYRKIPLTQKGRDPIDITLVENRPTLLPEILTHLLSARSRAKKEMAKAFGSGNKSLGEVYNGRQLALKIICNSVYGFTGADLKGVLPCLPVAALTTFFGRWIIEKTKELVEEWYPPAEVIYGDSVTADTPILIKSAINPQPHYVEIHELLDGILDVDTVAREKLVYSIPTAANLEVWSDQGWTRVVSFISHWTTKQLYFVETTAGYVKVTGDHSLLDSNGRCISPKEIHVGQSLLFSPWLGRHQEQRRQTFVELCQEERECFESDVEFARYWFQQQARVDECKVVSIMKLSNQGQIVYDLETENHHFAAGVGNLIVHNTDSVMVNFKRGSDEKTFHSMFIVGPEAAERCTEYFKEYTLTHRIVLEFEKVYQPYILYKKKGYMAIKYEHPDKGCKDVKGLPEVRRDYCDFVSETCDSVGNALLWDKDKQKALDIIQQALDDLVDGKVPDEKLVLSKSLSKKGYASEKQVQAVVAKKVAERDPSRAYRGGDRVHYFIWDINDPNDKRGLDEKAEDPQYVRENNLKLDFLWYVRHQLKNPLVVIMGPIVEYPEKLFDATIRTLKNRQTGQSTMGNYFAANPQAVSMAPIVEHPEKLLDATIRTPKNRQTRQRSISSFFAAKK